MSIPKIKSVPKVTVCVVTYNQEDYISECLESVVSQDTDFDFEVIVSDDLSTDKTREIVKEFAANHPNIKTIFADKNVGPYENYIRTHDSATGEYICHLDGDDYWLPGKLQKQADFLDANHNCNLVWARSLYRKDNEIASGLINEDDKFWEGKFFRGDIIRNMAIGMNSSLMYRGSSRLIERPNFDIIDYFRNVEAVKEGYACFASNKPLCIYRVGVGVASAGSYTVQLLLSSMNYIWQKYPSNRSDLFCSALLTSYSCLKRKRMTLFLRFFILALKCCSPFAIKKTIQTIKVYKKLKFPKFTNDL